MRLTFLGTGAAFCMAPNFQSNLLLRSASGKHLLIDCGTDIRFSLAAAGHTIASVDAIYISHLHADHVGGMEYMGFSTRYAAEPRRLPMYISETIVDDIWAHCLYAGMHVTDGDDSRLTDYFDPRPLAHDGQFQWEGIDFRLVPTRHVVGNEKTMYSYGLAFALGDKNVYFTADTLYAYNDPEVTPHMQRADFIFHDCETAATPTLVHSHFQDLLALPDDIRAKTWLYHYSDGELPDAVAAGFAGFVRCGQSFDFSAQAPS